MQEEVEIDIIKKILSWWIANAQFSLRFFAHFRHRYAPDGYIVRNIGLLALPAERDIVLTEHSQYQWLTRHWRQNSTNPPVISKRLKEFVI